MESIRQDRKSARRTSSQRVRLSVNGLETRVVMSASALTAPIAASLPTLESSDQLFAAAKPVGNHLSRPTSSSLPRPSSTCAVSLTQDSNLTVDLASDVNDQAPIKPIRVYPEGWGGCRLDRRVQCRSAA